MEKVTLMMKEAKRLELFQKAVVGEITVCKAAKLLDISERQAYRLKRFFKLKGVKGLIDGNRGRVSERRLGADIISTVIDLSKNKYKGFNDHHFTEKLEEVEDIQISREAVRQILRKAGIGSLKKKRRSKHRTHRERKPQSGIIVQIDGGIHDWLEGRGPKLTMIGAIDDAASQIPYACFVPCETSEAYMKLFMGMAKTKGLPHSAYADRHGVFQVERHEPTMAEQLNGKPDKTQAGRALDELGITLIHARSPQAKGRAERLWGTFQDRLISELRLADAKTIDDADVVLNRFLPEHDRKFGVKPIDCKSAWRDAAGIDMDKHLCFKEALINSPTRHSRAA
ncbi:MAG: ISNCY family transposase [Deltaproteobacteria bacterium]|nr:ISNCY family transposase [Deltaproteobacteria bacterium]